MSLKLIQVSGRLCSDTVNSNTTVLTKLKVNSWDTLSYIVEGLTWFGVDVVNLVFVIWPDDVLFSRTGDWRLWELSRTERKRQWVKTGNNEWIWMKHCIQCKYSRRRSVSDILKTFCFLEFQCSLIWLFICTCCLRNYEGIMQIK